MKGDELLAQRARALVYLYDQGAVGFSSAAEYPDFEVFLALEQDGFAAVAESLQGAGLVEVSGIAVTFQGTSYAAARFWLTGHGFEKASELVSGIRERAERPPKGPIGFQEPRDEAGSDEE